MPRLNDPRVANATAPLPAEAPDPAAFRYQPDFDALQTEIGKLERTGPGAVQWPDVVRQAETILATKSKDLAVAVWLAAGLAHTEGLPGLANGLSILRDLVERQWDTLYPPKARPRARSGVLEWLAVEAARTVPIAPLSDDQADVAIAAWDELQALERLLVEKLPPHGVAFTDLARTLRSLADSARRQLAARTTAAEAAPTPDAAAQPAMPASAPAPAVSAPAARAGSLAPAVASAVPPVDPEQILSALREAARSNALALLQADLCEPRAYALLRAVTWLAVTDPPPASQGRTAILPPTDQRQAEFTALRDAGDPAQLVLALERYCSGSGIFWLDGHRLAAAALGELGARYHGCVAAIIHGLAALIARLPALPALAFSDGQPFADAATRAWIETVVTPRPSSAAANTEQDPWKAGLSEAQALLLGGKAEAGLAGLVTAGRSAPSGRARFFWGLAQARLCIQAGASPVALPVLQHLDRLVEQHGLEDWEPAVVIETVQLLHDCLASPELAQVIPQADRAACAAAAFARLARLDPVQATRTAKLFRLTEEKDLKRGQ